MGNIINYLYSFTHITNPINSNTTNDYTKNTDTTNDSTQCTYNKSKLEEEDLNNYNDISYEESDKENLLKFNKQSSKNNLWKFLTIDRDGCATATLGEWNKYQCSSSWS